MLEFREVSRHFGEQDVLRRVNLLVRGGERVGVVGPNGAGKSTLFHLVTGEQHPDEGAISLPRDLRLGHVRQQLPPEAGTESLLAFASRASKALEEVREQIHAAEARVADAAGDERNRLLNRLGELQTEFEHQGGYDLESRARASLCGLGFRPEELDAPFARLSGGWRMRAELGRVLAARPDLLLLDEPSNYLDLPAVEWLQRFLREFKGTLMLISHDRYLLETLTDVTVEIAGGRLTRYPGGFSYYLEQREQRYLQQRAAKKNQDRRREQVERFVERFRAKNTKASQVQSRIKMLEKMEDVEVQAPVAQVAALRLGRAPALRGRSDPPGGRRTYLRRGTLDPARGGPVGAARGQDRPGRLQRPGQDHPAAPARRAARARRGSPHPRAPGGRRLPVPGIRRDHSARQEPASTSCGRPTRTRTPDRSGPSWAGSDSAATT